MLNIVCDARILLEHFSDATVNCVRAAMFEIDCISVSDIIVRFLRFKIRAFGCRQRHLAN